MQTQVMFYVLPEKTSLETDKTDESTNKLSHLIDVYYQACLQANYFYSQNQRVFIYTADQAQSEAIDEMLWSFQPDSFVPHNLVGEGPKQGAAVEISHQPIRGRRPILINLTNTVPEFAHQFNYMVDFVPNDEALKQLARERFKHCRQQGFQVNNQQIELSEEVTDEQV